MARPRLSLAVNWGDFEKAVHGVFLEALRGLCTLTRLSTAEPSISLEVYHLALIAHQDQFLAGICRYQFTIEPDSTSKPQPDDAATAPRLKKRPDFACTLKDMQALHPALSQISYYIECKRLGLQEGGLVFNDLYSEKGISRFMTDEHQYAKGCSSAAMIGFIEDMPPDQVFSEVNSFANRRGIPSLAVAASGWAKGKATVLPPNSLSRSFDVATVDLHHFWVDLTHCTFDVPSDHPPQSAGNPLPGVGGTKVIKRAGPPVVKRPRQKIAILGWGSLLWDRDPDFDSQHSKWKTGGPTLKIEFSRVSTTRRPGALMLVIDEVNGVPLSMRWCLSKRKTVGEARQDLRNREGTKVEDILVLRVDEPHGPFAPGTVQAVIADWAKQQGLTAVIWTGLPSNFEKQVGAFSPMAAIAYLKGLTGVRRSNALEYIKKAWPFVKTPLRTAFKKESEFKT